MPDRQLPATRKPLGFSTVAIHHGYDPFPHCGALNPPVFLSSTFAFEDSAAGTARFAGESAGYIYSRVGNPTVRVLEDRVAALEGGGAALATASGMGAITAVLWTLLESGDEIVADKTLYGCTFGLLKHQIERFGVTTHFVDLTDPNELRHSITPRTRLVFTETPANPNMRVVDISATAAICKQAGAILVVDNTYCTPYLQKPIELGADLVVHSATKYLGGHGDLIAGVVVGRRDHIDQIRQVGIKEMNGACISAFDAFLILRGLKTLALRMDRHCSTAQKLAEDLRTHPAVQWVAYPGLEDHPERRRLIKRQMRAGGGMIALELRGGLAAGRAFMDATRIATRAVSLGDAETLIQHPASMTHVSYSAEERARHGFSDGLIRLSVGLEDYEDLRDDLLTALDKPSC